ncbi:unnamed protein product [Peniophora sp. CBMAI 1063]|nr:unnamed protein product [Peniophora sp. CBMAI 1063]
MQDPITVDPCLVPYTAAHGSAGYAHQTTNPAPASLACTADFPPLPPHATEIRESEQGPVASIDAPYPVRAGYAQHVSHRIYHDHMHEHYPPSNEDRQSYTQPQPVNDNWRHPSIVPSIPAFARSQSSSLAHALGDLILKLGSVNRSTGPRTDAPIAKTDVTLLDADALRDTMMKIEDGEQQLRHDITFIHETGSPASETPTVSSRARTSDSSAESEPPPPPRRKRTRGPNKGPRKDRGFLACFFCRGRKVSCNPVADSGGKKCE